MYVARLRGGEYKLRWPVVTMRFKRPNQRSEGRGLLDYMAHCTYKDSASPPRTRRSGGADLYGQVVLWGSSAPPKEPSARGRRI